MGFSGCFSTAGEMDGADKESLVKLGRELHSKAVYEALTQVLAAVGGFPRKLLVNGGRRQEI